MNIRTLDIRTLALAGAFVALTASGAYADDPMANTYANTVTSKDVKTGASAQLYFNADMTYTLKTTDPKGQPFSYQGAWSLKDGGATICLTPHIPGANPPPPTTCSPLVKHAVGDSWTVLDDHGGNFAVTLAAGR